MSDIVFCSTWVAVEPRRFYNPLQSLLSSTTQPAGTALDGPGIRAQSDVELFGGEAVGSSGERIRNVATLRRAHGEPVPVNKDSVYKPIVRPPRQFNSLRVPPTLQAKLPFSSKPKIHSAQVSKERLIPGSRAVVLSAPQKRLHTYMLQYVQIDNFES